MLWFLQPAPDVPAFRDPNQRRRAQVCLILLFAFAVFDFSWAALATLHPVLVALVPLLPPERSLYRACMTVAAMALARTRYFHTLFRGSFFVISVLGMIRCMLTEGENGEAALIVRYLVYAVISPTLMSWLFSFHWLLLFLPTYATVTLVTQILYQPFRFSVFLMISWLVAVFYFLMLLGVWLMNKAEQEATNRARESDRARMAAEAASRYKSMFVATMSHEIRTPLNGIIGLTDLLAQSVLPPQQRAWVHTIHASGRMLLGIANHILDLSRLESGSMALCRQPMALLPTLLETVRVCATVAHAGVDVLCALHGPLPRRVWGDTVRLQQILLNVLGNAIKFTERGAVRLDIRTLPGSTGSGSGAGAGTDGGGGGGGGGARATSATVVQGAGAPPLAPPPDRVRLVLDVSDTGPGIEPEQAMRIFEPFAQADGSNTRRHGGAGLGLTIAQRLARAMHGDIRLRSTPKRGSVFTIEVQLEADPEGGEYPGPPSLAAAASGPVAIVSASAHVLEFLRDTCESAGLPTAVCPLRPTAPGESAAAAEEPDDAADTDADLLLAPLPSRPCAVLCDGIDALRAVRRRWVARTADDARPDASAAAAPAAGAAEARAASVGAPASVPSECLLPVLLLGAGLGASPSAEPEAGGVQLDVWPTPKPLVDVDVLAQLQCALAARTTGGYLAQPGHTPVVAAVQQPTRWADSADTTSSAAVPPLAPMPFVLSIAQPPHVELAEPASQPPPAVPSPARPLPAAMEQGALAQPLLLVAEDYPVNQMLIRAQLRRLGVDALVVNNGAEAVRAVQEQGAHRFAAVLMDLQMPVMDGYEAARQIRAWEQQRPGERTGAASSGAAPPASLPIIALTASVQAEADGACREAGMCGFVSKPFELADLCDALRRCGVPVAAVPSRSQPV